jgi:uncharacterized repeat protein (TIGR01451 family)
MKIGWSCAFGLALFCCDGAFAASVDLAVSISAQPGPVSVSSNLVYTIIVTNAGNTRATGVVVTDALPATFTFVSASASAGSCGQTNGIITCNLGTLNSGGSASISIRAQPTEQGRFENTVSVTANQVESTPEDNSASANTDVGLADLVLLINNPAEPIIAGQMVTYVLTVTNLGPDPEGGYVGGQLSVGPDVGAVVSAEPTAGDIARADNYLSWSVPILPPNGSASLTLEVWVLRQGPFYISARFVANSPNENTSNNDVADSTIAIAGAGVLQFTRATDVALEASGRVTIFVNRLGGAVGSVTLNFVTEDGTATAGTDYATTTGILTFANGETHKSFAVPIFKDADVECPQSFRVKLLSPSGGAVVGPETNMTVTIIDDDIVPEGITEAVSVTFSNSLVTAASSYSWAMAMSQDGQFALFGSDANDLVTTDANGAYDVFLRDLAARTTTLVSVNRFGTNSGNGFSDHGNLSGDGNLVVFYSTATDLVTNSTSGHGDVFLRDLVNSTTRLISLNTNGTGGGSDLSFLPRISSNGQVVIFSSIATDVVLGPRCAGCEDLIARDLQSGAVRLVNVSQNGNEPSNAGAYLYDISAEGRYVLFMSEASNLVAGDNNEGNDLFVRDLQTQTTELISVNKDGNGSGNDWSYNAMMTPDGRYVVFASLASDLVNGDENGNHDVFVRDLLLGKTRLVSINRFGTGTADGLSEAPAITPDGRYVVFVSQAPDLVALVSERHDIPRVYVRHLVTDTTIPVSVNCEGSINDNVYTTSPAISADGRYVAFVSHAIDFVPGDFVNQAYNVFRRDLLAGKTLLVSPNYGLIGGGNSGSLSPRITGDGATVLFESHASDLTLDDKNDVADIFVWRELPPGTNCDLRITSQITCDPSLMVITLAVTNFGPDTATGVVMNDTVPAGAQFFTASTTRGTCSVTATNLTCAVGSLTRKSGAIITAVATPTIDGTTVHAASLGGNEHDPFDVNNSTITGAALALPPAATLSIVRCAPEIFVNWRSAPPDVQLECAAALTGGWTPVNSGIFDNGSLKTLIVTNGSSASFYRLTHP